MVLLMAEIQRSPVEVRSFIPVFTRVLAPSKRWLALGFLNHQQYGSLLIGPRVLQAFCRHHCRKSRGPSIFEQRPVDMRYECCKGMNNYPDRPNIGIRLYTGWEYTNHLYSGWTTTHDYIRIYFISHYKDAVINQSGWTRMVHVKALKIKWYS